MPQNVPLKPYLRPELPRPHSYYARDFSSDTEEVFLARILFGEARSLSSDEQIEIGYTLKNRAERRSDKSIRKMLSLTDKWGNHAYSCMNVHDPNREKILNPRGYESLEVFDRCLDAARAVLADEHTELNFGQTHYAPHSFHPRWEHEVRALGRLPTSEGTSYHTFYKK